MVLLCIVGELGQGKTLGLAYMCWNNYYFKGRKIYANFNLYGMPFTPVKTIEKLFKMIPPETSKEEIMSGVEKFFGGDEMWRWVDSRSIGKGVKEKAMIVDNILASSRKSFVTIGYSTQIYDQVDKRIRGITDIICYPQMALDNSYCKILTFKGPKASSSGMLQPIYFLCEPIFAIYNTYEKVQPLPNKDTDASPEEEILLPLMENIAWVKYLKDSGYSEEKMKSYSDKMQDMLLRPEDKARIKELINH